MTSDADTTITPRVEVVLTSIVRNEEKNIARLLNSVKDVVDRIVICDTGSNDDTLSVLDAWSKQTPDIPVHVFCDQWRDFGHNRTLSIEHAKSVVPSCQHASTYMLFLDADMVLEHSFPTTLAIRHWKERELNQVDVWYLFQNGTSVRYHNIRLLRMQCPVVCVQPTHEYYQIHQPDPVSPDLFSDLPDVKFCGRGYIDERVWIRDIGDGGCKQDKFQRDIRLLTDYLATHPGDRRATFYLANSYKNAGDLVAAHKAYQQRIDLGEWRQEVYMSLIYQGECSFLLKDPLNGLRSFWKAMDVLPERPEAWYRCIRHFREEGKHQMAFALLQRAKEILPKEWKGTDVPLFLEQHIGEYLLDEEMSICAYYVGEHALGRESCERLAGNQRIPEHVRALAAKNAKFYP